MDCGCRKQRPQAQQLKALTTGFRILPISDRTRALASPYVQEGLVLARYSEDALHIAAAVYGDADALVSWNFKHLVRRSTRRQVNDVNARQNLRSIEILAPPEL